MPGLGKIWSAVVCAIREGGEEKGGNLCPTKKINEEYHPDGSFRFRYRFRLASSFYKKSAWFFRGVLKNYCMISKKALPLHRNSEKEGSEPRQDNTRNRLSPP